MPSGTRNLCASGNHPSTARCGCVHTECGCSATADQLCAACHLCRGCCTYAGRCLDCRCGSRISSRPHASETARRMCNTCAGCTTCCARDGGCHTCARCSRQVNGTLWCATCNICRNCCHCWICTRCTTNRPNGNRRCQVCATCQQCCNCVRCNECNVRRSSICTECDTCNECCSYPDDHIDDYWRDQRPEHLRPRAAPITYEKHDLKFWDAESTQFKRNPLKRHISVEIECDSIASVDGSALRKAFRKWKDSVVADGSLHNTNAHEVNTSPSNGDLFLDHIEEITSEYKKMSASCTEACGLHVHVDCKDLHFYDLRKVILLYARIEKALFELCAPRRLNANYSRVCGANYSNMSPDPELFKRQLLGKFYNNGGDSSGTALGARPPKDRGLGIKKAKSNKYNSVRYRALNLHSFFMRKSIEFRHHEGSVDFHTITNYALVCGHIIESANRMSEAAIRNLDKDPRTALLSILPANLVDYCKSVWKNRKADDWSMLEKQIKADLPAIPKDEVRFDRKQFRKKLRAEKKARAKINEFRLSALKAIITGQPLQNPLTPPQPQPTAQARS